MSSRQAYLLIQPFDTAESKSPLRKQVNKETLLSLTKNRNSRKPPPVIKEMINQMKSLQEEASGGAHLIPCFSANFPDTLPLLSDSSPMSPIS